ncbi:hypothetical protein OT109_05320 [Phycisphaeraceae bacterium D3-23]
MLILSARGSLPQQTLDWIPYWVSKKPQHSTRSSQIELPSTSHPTDDIEKFVLDVVIEARQCYDTPIQIVLVGHDQMGSAAVRLASRYPDLVSSVVAFGARVADISEGSGGFAVPVFLVAGSNDHETAEDNRQALSVYPESIHYEVVWGASRAFSELASAIRLSFLLRDWCKQKRGQNLILPGNMGKRFATDHEFESQIQTRLPHRMRQRRFTVSEAESRKKADHKAGRSSSVRRQWHPTTRSADVLKEPVPS